VVIAYLGGHRLKETQKYYAKTLVVLRDSA
jgi:hypothetical protein